MDRKSDFPSSTYSTVTITEETHFIVFIFVNNFFCILDLFPWSELLMMSCSILEKESANCVICEQFVSRYNWSFFGQISQQMKKDVSNKNKWPNNKSRTKKKKGGGGVGGCSVFQRTWIWRTCWITLSLFWVLQLLWVPHSSHEIAQTQMLLPYFCLQAQRGQG